MLGTVLLSLVAGFFAGNGLPYYLQGSCGEGRNPSPFPDRPSVSVLVGVVAFAVAAVAWHFAEVDAHPWPALLAAGAGVLAVGLIHARTWRDPNPWGKRAAQAAGR
ncbi:hypothetical protein [Dactylosporangium sp. CS-033363]|uniref:hypothetical protein n=1 Tax=Dactylosporangium sp. CS-033363 TaxID=3239935 RepID=UPI003D8AFB99